MAVRTANFEIAAFDAAQQPEAKADENIVELGLGGGHFSLWRRPSSGEWGMFTVRLSKAKTTPQAAIAIENFLDRVMLTPDQVAADDRVDAEGARYADRIEAGEQAVGADFLLNAWGAGALGLLSGEEIGKEDGVSVLDIIKRAFEEFAGFPTEPASGSRSQRRSTGASSTASSRRASSTRSRSSSAAS